MGTGAAIAAAATAGVLESGLLDPSPPYLLVDYYHGSARGKHTHDLATLVGFPNMVGAIIKATDGTRGPQVSDYNAVQWFVDEWPRVMSAGGMRYGRSWFRGAYHYLRFDQDGAAQADHYLDTVERAGGWRAGDILPCLDVERGGEGGNNHDNDAASIVRTATAFCNRVRKRIGQPTILYGRGAMRDLHINDRMGASLVWNPGYTSTMPTNGLVRFENVSGQPKGPWTLDDIALWQYAGTGDPNGPANLPGSVPGFLSVDMNVFVDGKRRPTLAALRAKLLRRASGLELAVAVMCGGVLAALGGLA